LKLQLLLSNQRLLNIPTIMVMGMRHTRTVTVMGRRVKQDMRLRLGLQ
jgi:hypothetical protein